MREMIEQLENEKVNEATVLPNDGGDITEERVR
jgi:hypothetical protein